LKVDYRGARGSNAGDDFHELWAVRQALRLLSADGDLKAVTLEGIADRDAKGAPPESWDGVDCALYFGGYDVQEANSIELLQLKYSAADAKRQWTIARLVQEKQSRRGSSIIGTLAKAWKGIRAARGDKPGLGLRAALITNQPVDPGVREALATAAQGIPDDYARKPGAQATALHRLVYASTLSTDEFAAFAAVLDTQGSTGSRFKIEEDTLRAISDWTEMDARAVADRLQRFVHRRMLPEAAGERITRESVLVEFGIFGPGRTLSLPLGYQRSSQSRVSRGRTKDTGSALGRQTIQLSARCGRCRQDYGASRNRGVAAARIASDRFRLLRRWNVP
jgi:hypothetical protein